MYRLTIFGEIFFSLSAIGDAMRYVDNEILTKTRSDSFSKPHAYNVSVAIKISNHPSCQNVLVFCLTMT